jgi:hypothetical protein
MMALLRIRPTSGHFMRIILHSSGVRGGNGEAKVEADKRMRQCLSEGGKRGFGAAGLLQTCTLSS